MAFHTQDRLGWRAPPPSRKATRPDLRDAETCITGNPAFEENLQHPRGMVFATSDPAEPQRFEWWRIRPLPADKRTPYWIMQVPPQIIHGHSPVFTAEGRAIMAALFRITNPRSQPGPRQMSLGNCDLEPFPRFIPCYADSNHRHRRRFLGYCILVGTPHGRAPATSLRVGLSWLWPTRVSVRAVALLALPVLARGGGAASYSAFTTSRSRPGESHWSRVAGSLLALAI